MRLRCWAAVLLAAVPAWAQGDPVAELARRIREGKVRVQFDARRGYLPWLLEALGIPAASQMLVFSKTSVQAMLIEPDNPRRLYFNDSVVVGTVRGGSMEVVAQDPRNGLQFYLVDQNAARFREDVPPFSRRPDCMNCHLSHTTGLAEIRLRSVHPGPTGAPLDPHAPDTDNRTPFARLWGGWFVTGTVEAAHLGNTRWDGRNRPVAVPPPETSDVAALLVFEHQARMMNLLARAARDASAVPDLVDAMLFVDEAPLPAPVRGASGFTEAFEARGPRDRRGRSLRDLDLRTRLLRYPCSYMIYSPAFRALPEATRAAIDRRMRQVLARRDAWDREAILEILRDTM